MSLSRYLQSLLSKPVGQSIQRLVSLGQSAVNIISAILSKSPRTSIDTINGLTDYFRQKGRAARAFNQSRDDRLIQQINFPFTGNVATCARFKFDAIANVAGEGQRVFTNFFIDLDIGMTKGDALNAMLEHFKEMMASYYKLSNIGIDVRTIEGIELCPTTGKAI